MQEPTFLRQKISVTGRNSLSGYGSSNNWNTTEFFGQKKMAAMMEQHNLRMLNERVHALLENERCEIALKDNLTFSFDKPQDLVFSVACSFDGSMIASGSSDNAVRLWDVASTKQLQQLDGHTAVVLAVAFSRDGKFIASASSDKTVRLWNAPLLFQIPHQPKEQEEEEEEENRKRQKIDK